MRDAVLATVERHPELFLDETATYVSATQGLLCDGLSVSPRTVGRVLAINGYTLKILEKAFFTSNAALSVAWVEAYLRITLRSHVKVDEAHRTCRAAERGWARSQRMKQAECYVSFGHGERTNFYLVMAHDKLFD